MVHALRYHGDFQLNFDALAPGATGMIAEGGDRVPLVPWPGAMDGVGFSYMERRGRKFVVVRVQFEEHDVVLPVPVPLDPERHLGYRRLGPEPTPLSDPLASTLLDDVIELNPDRTSEIALLLNRVNQVRRSRRDGGATGAGAGTPAAG
ncbi:MAG TPA: hypothetical protein VGD77_01170 [Gemmatimonadaceae bacterium]